MNLRFWIAMAGNSISVLGTSFGNIAQAWLVYELTNSKLAMGTIFMVGALAETVLRLLGGPLVDRFNRIVLLRNLNVLQALVYAVTPMLAASGVLEVWHLYVIAVAAGLSRALYGPAAMTVMPMLVPADQLVRANSLAQTLTTGVGLLGPAMAGALVAAVGPVPALVIDVASYLAAAVAMLFIPRGLGTVPRRAATGSYWEQMAEGFLFFRRVPALLVVMLSVAALNFATTANNTMMVPFVREQLLADAGSVGMLTSATTAGIFLGSILIGWVGQVKRPHLSLMLPLVLAGAAVSSLSLIGPGQVWGAAALLMLVGVGIGAFNPQSQALFQRMVPAELQGRVTSVRLTIAWGIFPLGSFFGSLVAEHAGLSAMQAAFGLIPVLVATLALAGRSLRSIGAPPASPAPRVA